MSPTLSLKSACQGTLDYYTTHAKEYCESTLHLDLHEIYEKFLKELAPGAHILDAGCGSGRDTKAFLERGYRVTATEASPRLAQFATEYTNQPCEIVIFQDMEFERAFDGIWACASLVHIPKSDIYNVLSRFTRALKSGGILYVSLKEGEGERVASDGRFFSDYTAHDFRAILGRFLELREIAFWKTEEVRSHTHRQPWLNFLLRKVQE